MTTPLSVTQNPAASTQEATSAADPALASVTTVAPTATSLPVQQLLGLQRCSTKPVQKSNAPPKHPAEVCLYEFDFPLLRPIKTPGNKTVEVSYRYGSTQGGAREPHHGVEFINPAGIAVQAAADGVVVVAGSDEEAVIADKYNFYGKVVVVQHQLLGFNEPMYTLYGHLLSIAVEAGQAVRAGQKLGEVGLGGVAGGTHLHFEVRWGMNDYSHTRNPELWLQPISMDGSKKSGALAGRFINDDGTPHALDNFVLKPVELDSPVEVREIYLKTYEDPAMLGQFPWQECFGVGELHPGRYRLAFINKKPAELYLDILPDMLTYVTFWVE